MTVSFLGGCLGVLFLIPLRYHFMVEMHGKFPWPEGTATTEILRRVVAAPLLSALSGYMGAVRRGDAEFCGLELRWLEPVFIVRGLK